MKLKVTKEEQAESLATLREMLKPGDTVYTILRHVSGSGMSRIIDMVIVKDGAIVSVAWEFCRISGRSWENDRYYGVRVGGCGMDMGFECVYSLGRYLYPDGFGEKCIKCGGRRSFADPKSKGVCAMTPGQLIDGKTPHPCEYRGRNGDTSGWDNDGGYALNQRWL